MALINRDVIPALLRPGADEIFTDQNIFPELWKEIYKQRVARYATEYDYELQGLPLGELKDEGAPGALGDMKQLYSTAYTVYTYSMGFQITMEAIMDNLYEDEFPQQALNLRNSLMTLKNTVGASVFNNADNFNSIGSDGQPLLSTQHPTSEGTLANTFSQGVGLNETSIEEAITIMRNWVSAAGLRINQRPHKLLVTPSYEFQASRILNSQYRTNTGNNDISALVHDKHIPGGYIVNPFITNPGFWGIITDNPHGFKYYNKLKPTIDFKNDTSTDNVLVKMLERYAMGYTSWRCFFGSIAAS